KYERKPNLHGPASGRTVPLWPRNRGRVAGTDRTLARGYARNRASVCRAVAREIGVDALVNMSQMTISHMSIQTTTPSPQQRQHWLNELRESYRARRSFFPAPVSERLQLVRCIHTRWGTGLRPRMRNRLEYHHGEVFVHLSRIHGET